MNQLAHPLPAHRSQRSSAARQRPQRERGAALIVTVLLLMVISLLALTAMTRNNLDERMAFNQRDRQVALQSAEAALREGEDEVLTQFGNNLNESFFQGMNNCADAAGWCYPQTDAESWSGLPADAWTTGNTTFLLTNRADIVGVSAQPRYLIEYQGTAGPIDPGLPCEASFVITSRAVGTNTNSVVTLQSQFRRRFGACQATI